MHRVISGMLSATNLKKPDWHKAISGVSIIKSNAHNFERSSSCLGISEKILCVKHASSSNWYSKILICKTESYTVLVGPHSSEFVWFRKWTMRLSVFQPALTQLCHCILHGGRVVRIGWRIFRLWIHTVISGPSDKNWPLVMPNPRKLNVLGNLHPFPKSSCYDWTTQRFYIASSTEDVVQ